MGMYDRVMLLEDDIDLSFFTEDAQLYIESCPFELSEDVKSSILDEAAHFSYQVQQLFQSGEDYKNLLKTTKELISEYDLDKSKLIEHKNSTKEKCIRVLQVLVDLQEFITGPVTAMKVTASTSTPTSLIGAFTKGMIIGFVVGVVVHVITRMVRYLIDNEEFNDGAKVARDVIAQLEKLKSKTKKPKDKEMIQKKIDSLNELINE